MTLRRTNLTASAARDRGSVLPFVLVCVVIGALIILPLLNYSMTVLRANQVVSQNTAEAEAARAGLRFSLADPAETYQRCGPTAGSVVQLPGPELSIETSTTCEVLRTAGESGQPMYGIAATWFGEPAASGISVGGLAFDEPLNDEDDWLDYTSNERDPDLDSRVILLPDLPVRTLTERDPTPHSFPDGFPFDDGFATCQVFFPGSYLEPVTVTGPTYFTSGLYYFEDEVRFAANTEPDGEDTHIVVGQGDETGCIEDVGAALSAVQAPLVHNISGLGATFVFGGEGRLVVDDTDGPVTATFNQRYVHPDDADHLASAQVSIMTVNGVWDGATFSDVSLPGELYVPRSVVADDDTSRPAVDDGYTPSTLTPVKRPPSAPQNLSVALRSQGAVFTWEAPVDTGGDPVTSYTVELVDDVGDPIGSSCTATELLACTIAGLTDGTTYDAVATATNTIGTSDPTDVVEFVPAVTEPMLTVPGAPSNPTVTESEVDPRNKYSAYVDAFVVNWDAPASTGQATIDAYEVTVSNDDAVWTCSTAGTTSCAVTGIADDFESVDKYAISVRARNVIGWSNSAGQGGFNLDEFGEVYIAPETDDPERYGPTPVLQIESTSSHVLEVRVAGYVAVPQGVIAVSTPQPANKSVELTGGVLSAWNEFADPTPGTFTTGLSNTTIQRVVRIATTVAGSDVSSEAVVQINETGAWAVNSWNVD